MTAHDVAIGRYWAVTDRHYSEMGGKVMSSRRRFLQQASTAGLAWCTSSLFGRFLSAQSPANVDQTARIFLNSRRTIAPLDRNLFGSFLEHLGRAIYEGIYDPGSKLVDANGFRRDVMDEIRKLGVPIVR